MEDDILNLAIDFLCIILQIEFHTTEYVPCAVFFHDFVMSIKIYKNFREGCMIFMSYNKIT